MLVGRFLLNPVFRALATSGAREVMTAAALLVVLGTAVVMDRVGLSMAMGAFMAGLLLAESNFRHQLEADIEPFRGLLLGLFFMSVGMSLDVSLVKRHVLLLVAGDAAARLRQDRHRCAPGAAFGSQWRDALRAGALLATAGEFAFVLLPVAGDLGLLSREWTQLITALAALSMLFAPLAARGLDAVAGVAGAAAAAEPEPTDFSSVEQASVIVIGFGRFGQVVNQILLSENIDVTVIDHGHRADPRRLALRLQDLLRRRHAPRRAARRRRRPGADRLHLHRERRDGDAHRRAAARGVSARRALMCGLSTAATRSS